MIMTTNHRAHKKYVYGAIVVIISVAVKMISTMPIVFLFFNSWDALQGSVVLCYSYINFFRMFYTMQFILASLAIRSRFKVLNNYLNYSTTFKDFRIIAMKGSKNFWLLRHYHSLCDGIDIINRTFTSHFILLFAISLVSNNMEIVNFLVIYKFDFVVNNGFWCVRSSA